MDKRYEHNKFEKKMRELWEAKEVYLLKNNPGKHYSIDTPPPTVSGSLHIGHIFSYTHTDIIARYKRMNNFSVFYPFGFDDNGLPTEKFVEKKNKIRARSMPRFEFIQLCINETKLAKKKFEELWRQVGLSVDWNNSYSTISDRARKISQESFIRLYKQGFVYRKNEPGLYCPNCRTAVAQAELEDKEINSLFNTIIFKTKDGEELLIGTTRPELLASCVAIFYNPEDQRYKHLKGKNAIVPIFGHSIKILEDKNVDTKKGTGLVMCCTFGDRTDILWFKKYNFPYLPSIDINGKLTKRTGLLEGLKIQEARNKILNELKNRNLLKDQKQIKHYVNVHERCSKEIEFIFIKQWFLKILEYKNVFLKQGEKIDWYPKFMKSRYVNWVKNINWDWCLSRQRYYGIPFPVWLCKDCNEIILAKIENLPIDPQETPYKGKCPKCNSSNIEPETDVMDTWNTSSLTPYICYSLFIRDSQSVFENKAITDKFLPMSMRPQAHDIIRTWLFYTIVKTYMHHKTIPWKNVVISGHVLSDQKGKISKSKGNVFISPEKLLEKYPADAVRYWTASGILGQDLTFSENQLKIGQKLLTKIWNAFRFIKEHIEDLKEIKQPVQLDMVNEWILHRISSCWENYKKYLDQHEFSLAIAQIEKFFWRDFCDNYLELIKDQLFKPEKYKLEEINTIKWALYTVGLRILQLYSPYLPHITETIYQLIYKKIVKVESIHQTKFKNFQLKYNFEKSEKKFQIILKTISEIRKLKTENKLSLKTELEIQIYSENKAILQLLKENEQLIIGITKAKKLEYIQKKLNKSSLKDFKARIFIKNDIN